MMSLGVVLLSGVALAVTMTGTTNGEGTSRPDLLIGNASKNSISGRPGEDYVAGKGAADTLYDNRNNDEVRDGGGPVRIYGGMHSESDTMTGGNDNDTIYAVDEFSPG